ncbi:hypothetical protein CEXT_397661 [Caerostris extrusa]|uniref:Uncharacterized protein n=1 Tax=Caerostris extrusa TaxID=172846 RepID=A0AAV4XTU4_CAEEX|nr:hypothetical protein CEXT_397661 [Caerostris extrusa]
MANSISLPLSPVLTILSGTHFYYNSLQLAEHPIPHSLIDPRHLLLLPLSFDLSSSPIFLSHSVRSPTVHREICDGALNFR